MSSLAPPVVADQSAVPFPSLDALLEAHDALIMRRHDEGDTPALLDDAIAFSRAAQATGGLLYDEGDRRVAQGLLDYWSNTLYRNCYDLPDTLLAPYDPTLAPELRPEDCPYVGLNAFQPDQHALFYGRERLVDALVALVEKNRLILVVGPSGSGKSSLVLGGLVPRLQEGVLEGSKTWRYLGRMVPGSNPFENLAHLFYTTDESQTAAKSKKLATWLQQNPLGLAQAVNRVGRNRMTYVLVIDQFEELFTLSGDEDTQRAFSDLLIALAEAEGPRHTVILTMRSDFEGRLTPLEQLKSLTDKAQLRVTPPSRGDLIDAIEKPAELRGLKIDEEVVNSLVKDIQDDVAALPLLQFALLELWHKRERNRITWRSYEQIGPAHEALGHSAEQLYRRMSLEEQERTKRIFLRLVRPGQQIEVVEGGRVVRFSEMLAFTSKRISRRELYHSGLGPDQLDPVVQQLINRGLLRLSKGETHTDDQIEVAHEALVRNWQTLSNWLDEERAALVTRRRHEAKAEEWVLLGKGSGGLLDEIQLHEVEAWTRGTNAITLGYDPVLDELIAASRAALDRKAKEEEAFRKRKPLLEAAERWEALGHDRTALWRGRQLREALGYAASPREDAFLTASLKEEVAAKKAKEDADRREREQTLALLAEQTRRAEAEQQRRVEQERRAEAEWRRQEQELRAEADQQRADSESRRAREQARLARWLRLASLALTIALVLAIIATLLAVQSYLAEQELNKEAKQTRSTAEARRIIAEGAEATAQRGQALAQTSDAAAQGDRAIALAAQATAQQDRADAQLAATIAAIVAVSEQRAAQTAQADRARAETAEAAALAEKVAAEDFQKTAIAVQAQLEATSEVAKNELAQLQAAFAQLNATQQVLLGQEGQRRLEDAQKLARKVPELVNQRNPQLALLAALAAAERDQRMEIENALQLAIQANLTVGNAVRNQDAPITSVIWSPDSAFIITTGGDVARIWKLGGDTSPDKTLPHRNDITSAAWSSDGTRIVTASSDGTARIWDAQSGRQLFSLLHGTATVTGAAWSPDDTRIVTSSSDGVLRLWDATRGTIIDSEQAPNEVVARAAWSPGGTQFITAGGDGIARIRDGTTVALVRSIGSRGQGLRSAAWSPNGLYILTAGPRASIWLVDNGNLVGTLLLPPNVNVTAVNSATWSPSGRSILTADNDGIARIWNTEQRTLLGELSGPARRPVAVPQMASWSPDGRIIAVGSNDGTVRLYYVNFDHILQEAQGLVNSQRQPLSEAQVQDVINGRDPFAPTPTPTRGP